MHFQIEEFSGVYLELEPFFEAHYNELATLKDKIPKVEPAYGLYAKLEAAGSLHVATAREAGALVGYYVGVVTPHPHYKSVLLASADLYYLAPDYRKAQNGITFLQFIEASLKERGVQMTVMGTKMSKDLGALYEHLGYQPTDVVWRKWIGK